MDDSNGMRTDIPVSRRTALQLTGAGIVGSAFGPEIVAAEQERQFDATFHLFEGIFDFIGDPAPHFKNMPEDSDTGNTLEIGGTGIFTQDGTAVSGGGSFRVRNDERDVLREGTWTADEVVEWSLYDAGETWPANWFGGLLELEASFPSRTPGISAADTLIIECHVGSAEDERRFPTQGTRVGAYDVVEDPPNAATIFHLAEKQEM